MVLVLQLYDVYRGSILGFATQKMLAVKRIALVPPNHRVNRVFCVAGFRPGRRACCLARPSGRNLSFGSSRKAKPLCGGKGPNNGRALRDAPCTVTPRPAPLERMDASLGRADQLAESVLSSAEGLKQGPPSDVSVRPGGRAAGVGQWER